MNSDQTSIGSHISKMDSDLIGLVSAKNAIVAAQNSVASANQSFNQLNANVPIDVQTAELAVTQKQNALFDAQQTLADCYIRAPFDGVVANIDVQKSDPVSSATVIATVVTKQQTATVTMNEIDAAGIKVGQKAALTFDALPDLNVGGLVMSVDGIGTVTQGVVNYTVQIGLEKQSEQIKPGMSVSATIVTFEKPDVLIVPSSAIKSSGMKSSVQMFDAKYDSATARAGVVSSVAPHSVSIEVGDSNDTDTEVISGLKEGDQIVVRTVTGAQASSSSSSATARTSGGLFGTGNSARIPR